MRSREDYRHELALAAGASRGNRRHHAPALATANRALTGLVSVSDLLRRLGGLGYGYREDHETNFAEDPGFTILAGHYPAIRPFDLARFTFEMGAVLEEVQAVVSRVYGIAQ